MQVLQGMDPDKMIIILPSALVAMYLIISLQKKLCSGSNPDTSRDMLRSFHDSRGKASDRGRTGNIRRTRTAVPEDVVHIQHSDAGVPVSLLYAHKNDAH